MSATPSLSIGILAVVLLVVLNAGFWVGLIALWRGRRGASWWLMALGLLLLTLFSVAALVYSLIPMPPPQNVDTSLFGPGFATWVGFMIAGMVVVPLGILLFSTGFALHGLKMARVSARIGELEQLAGAMSEEISQLKAGGGPA